MQIAELTTPALLLDSSAFEHNLSTLASVFPGPSLRPHVKAHKSTDIARAQLRHGHQGFTCATIREVEVLAGAGLGDDLLLANEVMDARRIGDCVATTGATVILAVDSSETILAAANGGVGDVVIDINIGLPRCGATLSDVGRLADLARSKGLNVRGVMGYEGHLMMELDRSKQRAKVEAAFLTLREAHEIVGGELVSGGGTGTFAIHKELGMVTEVQCGSYCLMDSHYAQHGFDFRQALLLLATIIHVSDQGWMVADCGLKANGMDHGNPSVNGAEVLFCSDEHITFVPTPGTSLSKSRPGDRVLITPAHCDPTVAYHEQYWLVDGGADGLSSLTQSELAAETVHGRWAVDMRAW